VLEGAPALVAAVDRYVHADSAVEAALVTAEVAEAVRRGLVPRAVSFDASALRATLGDGSSRKLGLGSSAAILVATMAAFRSSEELGSPTFGRTLFDDALTAHRAAQGGGSGVDVAASCFGGVVSCRLDGAALAVDSFALPDCTVEAWACAASASTSKMLSKVREFAGRERALYTELIRAATEGSELALRSRDAADLVAAIRQQRAALAELGRRADVPIVLDELDALDGVAAFDDAVMYPAGAGGGDVALYVGPRPSGESFRLRAAELGLVRLDLVVGASGVGPC
jgi:phosphomevalonate kinase